MDTNVFPQTNNVQTAFCESGAPGANNAGEEYLHLPAIVDAAESSPHAAREAANTLRRFLSKEYYQRGYAQYNAIMLFRILTDNPGRPFTQNFDDKFVSTTKQLLREGKDQSVQQILRETLDYLEAEKLPGNDSLGPLMQMWRKEKGKAARFPQGPVVSNLTSDVFVPTHDDDTNTDEQSYQYPMRSAGPPQQQQSRAPRTLPAPDELAARIEEAKTTARLLVQTVQSTPQAELPGNDLVKEFAERSRAAQKSIGNYMNCESPRPDEDTMLTLIETNDQLNIAMSKHQRAVLTARKALGMASPSPAAAGTEPSSYVLPQHTQGQNVYSNISQPQQQARDPYQSSPPRSPQRNANAGAPTLPPMPPRDGLNFTPPPGPPPNHRTQLQNNTYEYEDAYSAPSGPPPGQATKTAEPFSPVSPVDARPAPLQQTSSAAYGVSENPFADDAYATEPQQPKQYSLFDRAQHNINAQPSNPAQEERK